jgi:hypothetical protein
MPSHDELDPELQWLVTLLAQRDALFTPFRHSHSKASSHAASAIWERRAEYLRRGLPVVGGGSPAERQRHSRAMKRAKSAGLIKITGRTMHTRVRLTPAAEESLSALTACYSVRDSWPLLELMAQFAEIPGTTCETDIIGKGYDEVTSRDLADVEHRALPLLARDWLASNSDSEGRVDYFITPAGRAALAEGPPAPPESLPDYSHAAGDYYDTIYTPGLRERETWQPTATNNVVIPLSCGMWGDRKVLAHA